MDKPTVRVVETASQVCEGQRRLKDTDADGRNALSTAVNLDEQWMWFRLNRNLVVTGATLHNRIGQHVYDLAGIEEVWGPLYDLVLVTGETQYVRRFWQGAVWEAIIEPHGAGGLHIECRVVDQIVPDDLVTLTHHADALTRVLASLAADVQWSESSPVQPAVPQSSSEDGRGRPQLHVLPSV